MNRALACLALLAGVTACRDTAEGITTQFVGSYTFSTMERRTITRIAGAAARDARKQLPALSPLITLQVRSGKEVIPEIGAGAEASPPEFVRWTVDSERPEGIPRIAESYLRQALFHEFHHLVRGRAHSGSGLMDSVITEGLATAFERDFARAKVPWGEYPDDVAVWADELSKQPADAKSSDWMFRHPDGRRWIGMRAGTYLVDRAMQQLNRTSAELVALPTADILAAANAGR